MPREDTLFKALKSRARALLRKRPVPDDLNAFTEEVLKPLRESVDRAAPIAALRRRVRAFLVEELGKRRR